MKKDGWKLGEMHHHRNGKRRPLLFVLL